MRTIDYGSDSEILTFEFPQEWNPSDLDGLTIQIADRDGNELLAASAATLYSETTLDSDTSRYSFSIILADGSGALSPGDHIRISGVLGYEDHVVKGWSPSDLTATLEGFIDRDFEAGATINRLCAVADIDVSDTDTFSAGKELVITWTPAGTGSPSTELGIISQHIQVEPEGFALYFRSLYPRAYEGLIKPWGRMDEVKAAAIEEVRDRLLEKDTRFDISLVRDQSILRPAIAAACAVNWTLNGDKNINDERKYYERRLEQCIERLSKLPVWVDLDDDAVQDDDETIAHPQIFYAGW
jgi:hypothetical protein